MTIHMGSFGRIRIFEDFLSRYDTTAEPTTTFTEFGNIAAISVSAGDGTTVSTVDEPGGVVSVTTHSGDDDNVALHVAPFKPADGGCIIEARFKAAAVTTPAVFCGFFKTLAVTTPVMATELGASQAQTTATTSFGMLFDIDCTTDVWYAVSGVTTTASTGSPTAATTGMVADEFDVVRVEITSDKGDVYCYLNGNLIKKFAGVATVTDVYYPVLMIENRSGAANTLEVDYFYAEGARDWTV